MRQRRPLLIFALALLCLSFAACGAKQYPMQITVVNRSTTPSRISASALPRRRVGRNRLETTLKEEAPGSTWAVHGRTAGSRLPPSVLRGGRQPVNPDHDPSSLPLKTATSSFSRRRISASPSSWTPLRPGDHDQKIAELYARTATAADVISQDGHPGFDGWRTAFTNMQNLLSEES